jgi:hypothetical protein
MISPPVDHIRFDELDERPHTASTLSRSIDWKRAARGRHSIRSILPRALEREAANTIRWGKG